MGAAVVGSERGGGRVWLKPRWRGAEALPARDPVSRGVAMGTAGGCSEGSAALLAWLHVLAPAPRSPAPSRSGAGWARTHLERYQPVFSGK